MKNRVVAVFFILTSGMAFASTIHCKNSNAYVVIDESKGHVTFSQKYGLLRIQNVEMGPVSSLRSPSGEYNAFWDVVYTFRNDSTKLRLKYSESTQRLITAVYTTASGYPLTDAMACQLIK